MDLGPVFGGARLHPVVDEALQPVLPVQGAVTVPEVHVRIPFYAPVVRETARRVLPSKRKRRGAERRRAVEI